MPEYYDPPKANTPWYRQFEYYRELADRYVSAFRAIPEDEDFYHAEARSFAEHLVAKLIFESNTLENAGLPTEGETRKVIDKYFPEIPDSYGAYRNTSVFDLIQDKLTRLLEKGAFFCGKDIIPSVKFGRSSRDIIEVSRHYLAYKEAIILLEFQTDDTHANVLIKRDNIEKAIDETDCIWHKFITRSQPTPWLVIPALICANQAKYLHNIMAEGLLPPDAGVEAGEYRIDNRSIGIDVSLPAPELVPEAMKKYVEFANLKVIDFLEGKIDRYSAAAEITYRFLMIHPFPDFNGRLSRLLLTMFLQFSGCPFPVSVLGDKRNRKNYLTSLKMANRNRDTTAYAAWIAKKMVEQFQEFDRKMELVGRESVLSFL